MSRTSSYTHSFHLPVERQAVFELFANPEYLDLLTPSWFRLRPLSEVSGKLEAGAEICYQLRWRGLPFRWASLLTDWQAPESFAYEQKKGPYRFFRHEHFFKSVDGGTKVCDRILFRAPGGDLADRLIARPDLRRILDYREQRALPVLRILQERGQLSSRRSRVRTASAASLASERLR